LPTILSQALSRPLDETIFEEQWEMRAPSKLACNFSHKISQQAWWVVTTSCVVVVVLASPEPSFSRAWSTSWVWHTTCVRFLFSTNFACYAIVCSARQASLGAKAKLKFGAKTVKFLSPCFGCMMFVLGLVSCLCFLGVLWCPRA
jgi:hypothetical protein